MKKYLLAVLILAFMFTLCACTNENANVENVKNEIKEEKDSLYQEVTVVKEGKETKVMQRKAAYNFKKDENIHYLATEIMNLIAEKLRADDSTLTEDDICFKLLDAEFATPVIFAPYFEGKENYELHPDDYYAITMYLYFNPDAQESLQSMTSLEEILSRVYTTDVIDIIQYAYDVYDEELAEKRSA